MKRARAPALVALVLALSFACNPVVGAPLSEAPINDCPQFACERYFVNGAGAKAGCNSDETTRRSRCDVGQPDYPFTVLVDVPDSSIYAAGRSLVMTSNDLKSQADPTRKCDAAVPGTSQCTRLPEMVAVEGTYRVTATAAAVLGVPSWAASSIPVRVTYVPFAPGSKTAEAATEGLPVRDRVTSSQAIPKTDLTTEIKYVDTVSVGRYVRIAYPEPPFDAFFPPAISVLPVTQNVLDDFVLGVLADTRGMPPDKRVSALDDESGATRTTTVTRKEGLDGWRVWLIDKATRRRISTIKPLTGTKQLVVLHTVGANVPGTSTLQDAFIVVAPPERWLAVPRLESAIINGAGLGVPTFFDVPELPPPTTLTGDVAHANGAVLTGIPSRLLFTSTGLGVLNAPSTSILKYSTAVSTDEAGHFATVLPRGFYDVTIEPAEGTGYSKVKRLVDTTVTLAKTFDPPARTSASGLVVLADGRPLSEADVLALPSDTLDATTVKPRPARARTDREGKFRFEVDQGQYALTIDPQAGTDFPRTVQIRSFGTGTIDVGKIVVAPPARLAFVLRDTNRPLGNAIVHATVRVFAEAPGRGTIEIGRAMTGDDGRVEILLAQQAR